MVMSDKLLNLTIKMENGVFLVTSSKGKQKACPQVCSNSCQACQVTIVVFVAEAAKGALLRGAVVRTTTFKSCIVTPASTDEERDDDRYIAYLKETFGDQGDNTDKIIMYPLSLPTHADMAVRRKPRCLTMNLMQPSE